MRRAAVAVSIASVIVGVVLLMVLVPGGPEAQTAGIGFTLGLLGFPLTWLGYLLLDVLFTPDAKAAPSDWLVVAACYFLQWQAIAALLWQWGKRRSRREQTA